MKKIAIYGTGSSAIALMKELGNEVLIDRFYETSPKISSFDGKPVYSPDNLQRDIDELYVASMYYPDIIELLEQKSFPIDRVTVAVAHRDDPRYGTIRIAGKSVLPEIPVYRAFKSRINDIESLVDNNTSITFFNRLDHLVFALSHAPKTGQIIEFGVYRGESLLHLAQTTQRPVWGFDSFRGFAEGSVWNAVPNHPRETQEIPNKLRTYKYLVPGYFEDTLDQWLAEQDLREISFIHYDAGHYEATRFVLTHIQDHLKTGSIIVFDELIPSPTELRANEYDALVDTLSDRFAFLSRCGQSVSVKLL